MRERRNELEKPRCGIRTKRNVCQNINIFELITNTSINLQLEGGGSIGPPHAARIADFFVAVAGLVVSWVMVSVGVIIIHYHILIFRAAAQPDVGIHVPCCEQPILVRIQILFDFVGAVQMQVNLILVYCRVNLRIDEHGWRCMWNLRCHRVLRLCRCLNGVGCGCRRCVLIVIVAIWPIVVRRVRRI